MMACRGAWKNCWCSWWIGGVLVFGLTAASHAQCQRGGGGSRGGPAGGASRFAGGAGGLGGGQLLTGPGSAFFDLQRYQQRMYAYRLQQLAIARARQARRLALRARRQERARAQRKEELLARAARREAARQRAAPAEPGPTNPRGPATVQVALRR